MDQNGGQTSPPELQDRTFFWERERHETHGRPETAHQHVIQYHDIKRVCEQVRGCSSRGVEVEIKAAILGIQ